MAERARAEGPAPDPAQFEVGKAVGDHAGAAARAGVDPTSAEALAVVERLEAVNDWPEPQTLAPDDLVDAWEWYARALRAHAA
jgi:hypothetical protein